MRSQSSRGTPGPASTTRISTRSPSALAVSVGAAGGGLKRSAFATRLASARSRVPGGAPRRGGGGGGGGEVGGFRSVRGGPQVERGGPRDEGGGVVGDRDDAAPRPGVRVDRRRRDVGDVEGLRVERERPRL